MLETRSRNVAREISYANSTRSRARQALIRSVENMTGRLGLIGMAGDYEPENARGRDFWDVMIERYRRSIQIVHSSLVVSNRSYGNLDALMPGHILSRTIRDFRILATETFRQAGDLNRTILPIRFDKSHAAIETNLATRRAALDHLDSGGCIGVFSRQDGFDRAAFARETDGPRLALLHRA
jgi:hypothetical protein